MSTPASAKVVKDVSKPRASESSTSSSPASERRKKNQGSEVIALGPFLYLVSNTDEGKTTLTSISSHGVYDPVLHFSSGLSNSVSAKNFVKAIKRGEYLQALSILARSGQCFSRFQVNNLRWLIAILIDSGEANYWKIEANRFVSTSQELAAFAENEAFAEIRKGRFDEAITICKEALLEYHSDGLWINLLVAMQLKDTSGACTESIEEILFELSEPPNRIGALLELYLNREPDFNRPVCNGG